MPNPALPRTRRKRRAAELARQALLRDAQQAIIGA